MRLTGPLEFIAQRVAQRGKGYADLLEQAIIARGPDFFTVETDHPAYAELAEKFPPSAKEVAEAQAALLRRFHELWDAIHDLTDPTPEKLDRIINQLPCGGCQADFVELLKELPPVYDSLAGWRYRSWEWHDRIDARLGKPRPTFQEVARARNWPTPEA